MWPGQQPPGGEQNPQDPNNPNYPNNPNNPPTPASQPTPNPYQQPGYQQPNPYQQPGYQQPNPYQQQPGWNAPTTPLGPPQPPNQGGGGNRTKIVAIVAAAAVVVAAGVTGFLVLGGDKDDDAKGGDKKSPAASQSASEKPTESASAGANPRGGDNAVQPIIPGWQPVVNTKHKTVFDVPQGWEVSAGGSDQIIGFEYDYKDKKNKKSHSMTTVSAPAEYKSKWCSDDADKDGNKDDTSLAGVGTRGEDGAKTAAEAAENRVPWWIYGGYTEPSIKAVKVDKPTDFTNAQGVKGSLIKAHSEGTPQKGKCASEGKAVVFAFQNADGDYVSWDLWGAKGVKDELDDATIDKILSSVRYYKDPTTS
ncbi:hypothetical protein G3I40_22450 [Streptomyces sp. SID14478]|uniref:hypothetical protein n=1 Tax=Streptomyces sp. SID14478 TaxID=2706073 RepID=UPI0013DBD2C1|nr:hypothetical protein [Streptomyces sp. SID14478]NEB77956.1 hypothetical protein [Streptomyces sp. SID14478]